MDEIIREKTTLSRIIRALEIGYISDKYENPQFEISIKDVADATPSNLIAHGKKIRVFNEDFVKDNLRFIINKYGIVPTNNIFFSISLPGTNFCF